MSLSNNISDKADGYLDEVKKSVNNIKYGSITLIIQDGKVIQIEKKKKIRL